MPDFEALPLWGTIPGFVIAAALVWLGGVRLAAYAEAVADRTGLGHAFVGALLLGGITSLPEAGTTASAAAIGNAPLAVNNLFGGIALQVTTLAIADWVARGAALSSRVGDDTVLLQGSLLIVVLSVAVAGVILPETMVFGVGAWAIAVFATAVISFFFMHQHASPGRWMPRARSADGAGRDATSHEDRHGGSGHSGAADADTHDADGGGRAAPGAAPLADVSTAGLTVRLTIAALVIVAAGYVLARTGDVIATDTGLGSGFIGAVALAVATSLPEVSTTLGAVRIGAYAMAYANIFGANILDAAIVLLADAVYAGPPVLDETATGTAFAAVLGILLTAVFLVGLVKRRRTVVAGLGIDSGLVLLLYLAGVAVLFVLR